MVVNGQYTSSEQQPTGNTSSEIPKTRRRRDSLEIRSIERGDQTQNRGKRVTFAQKIQTSFKSNSLIEQKSQLTESFSESKEIETNRTSDSNHSNSGDINTIQFNSKEERKSSCIPCLTYIFQSYKREKEIDEMKSREAFERAFEWGSGPFYNDFLTQIIEPSYLLKSSKLTLKKLKSKQVSINKKIKDVNISFDELFEPEYIYLWSSCEVCAWLKLIGLNKYTDNFLLDGVAGSTLFELSRSKFKIGLNINNEDHLTSLEIGIINLLTPRKLKNNLRNCFFNNWNLNSTIDWLIKRGFNILVNRFIDKCIHGGVMLFIKVDYLIDNIIDLKTITKSNVVRESLKASILREQYKESLFLRSMNKYKKRPSIISDNEVYDWNLNEIEQWLRTVNIGHKINNFKEHCVNGTILLNLDYEMMREIGLSEIMSFVLFKALNHLRNDKATLPKRKASSFLQNNSQNIDLIKKFDQYKQEFTEKLELIRKNSLSGSDSSVEETNQAHSSKLNLS